MSEIIKKTGQVPFELGYGTPKEQYIKRVATSWWNISAYLKRVEYFKNVFSVDVDKSYLKLLKLEEDEYYQLHYANFLIHLVALLDQMAILIHDVYGLNHKETEKNYRVISSYIKNRNKPCFNKLKAFSNFLQPYKQERNKVAHSGEYLNNDIEHIVSFWDNADTSFFSEQMIAHSDKDRLEKKAKFANQIVEAQANAVNHLSEVMINLENEFLSRKKKLK